MNLADAEHLFHRALELPSAQERSAFLKGACGDNEALRRQVEGLLAAHEKTAPFLPTEPGDRIVMETPSEGPGTVIGRYKLLQQIGEGGMGVVYMAEQTQPVVRKVAFKIIKLGMDTKQVVARFEAERQALALMDHPNIAKVLDAGATETGRPYFVMELVRGIPITEYCDKNHLSARQRLELFIPVCQAIQHAHQKGIIHRDIKPSNIMVTLVDGQPLPMVIDFGIAKALHQRLTDKTLFTNYAQMIGTPAYMSPEQAEMSKLDVDTRTDVYSLGVLLYELLTGTTPFSSKELLEAGYGAMQRIIAEQEPPRPSTRLSTMQQAQRTTVAQNRRMEAMALIRLFQGDLDWIVMKCLEKERGQRYETAAGLAADSQRYLSNEPITARPPSSIYRFHKFCRRNRLAVAAGIGVVSSLLVGLSALSWMLVRERQAQREQSQLRILAQEAEAREYAQREVAEQRLYESLVAQARALLANHSVGYREEVFSLLRQAKALRVPHTDTKGLKQIAVACLGDFVGLTPTDFPSLPLDVTIIHSEMAPGGQAAAFHLSDGSILMRDSPAGTETGRLRPDYPVRAFCFNPEGTQLIMVQVPERRLRNSLLSSWERGLDGVWHTVNTEKMPGADGLLESQDGVFVLTVDAAPSWAVVESKSKAVVFRAFEPTPGNVALSPKGDLLATESVDRVDAAHSAVDVWNLSTGKRVSRLRPRIGSFISSGIAFSPDGHNIACLSPSALAVCTMSGGEAPVSCRAYFSAPVRAGFLPGKTVIAMPLIQQKGVRLWDWVRNDDIAYLSEPEQVFAVSAEASGETLLTTSRRHARLYRLDTSAEKLAFSAHDGGVPAVLFSPDGSHLATVGKDNRVRCWDARTGQSVWHSGVLSGPQQALTFSPEGRLLVTAAYQSTTLTLCDVASGRRVLELDCDDLETTWQLSVELSRDGRYLATAGAFGVRLWHMQSEEPNRMTNRAVLIRSFSYPGFCNGLKIAPNSRYLAFTRGPGDVSVGQAFLWEIGEEASPRAVGPEVLVSGQSVSFTPDSRFLLVQRSDLKIVVLDVETGNASVEGHLLDLKRSKTTSDWGSFSLSPDGTRIAVASPSNDTTDIWDWKSGDCLYSLPPETGVAWYSAWSPDGKRVAISRSSGVVSIWNLDKIDTCLSALGL